MSWPKSSTDPLDADASPRSVAFARNFMQHVQDGFTPELALDLVLNELVVAAAKVTQATAAAVALARGDEMVCRATTGDHAPDLGIPIHTRTGLSGACLRSRSPQNCRDTESDERVDTDVSRRLGIRSILVVPILDGTEPVGIIEVFSPHPLAFSESDEVKLREFARDSLKLRQLSLKIAQRTAYELAQPVESSALGQDLRSNSQMIEASTPRRSRSDHWTLLLAALVAVAAVALIFLVGFRTGWLRAFSDQPAPDVSSQPAPGQNPLAPTAESPAVKTGKDPVTRTGAATPADPTSGGLVIYERGKLIYRSHPPPSKSEESTQDIAKHKTAVVWLSPNAAQARLLDRVEPEYPADARNANRSGDVTLEILVREDGSVGSVRGLNGDPLLIAAAAAAVRNWRYQPYERKGQAGKFQTDVTITFALSK